MVLRLTIRFQYESSCVRRPNSHWIWAVLADGVHGAGRLLQHPAMMLVAGQEHLEGLGLYVKSLMMPELDIKVAGGKLAGVLGACFMTVSGKDAHKRQCEANQLLLIMKGV